MESERAQDRSDLRRWDDNLFLTYLEGLGGSGSGPVVVVDSTGSTNVDVADQIREGAPAGFTVLAHEQVAGRGRLDRVWSSPVGAGITMSIAVRPTAPLAHWGWLPLLAGIAVTQACTDAGLGAVLKWPNDIVVITEDGLDAGESTAPARKLGGILVERVDTDTERFASAAVIGIGLNTDLAADELPTPLATSFRLEGCNVEREFLVAQILVRVGAIVELWDAAAGDVVHTGLLDRYRDVCSTLGHVVRAERPGGDHVVGRAVDVDLSGGLIIEPTDGESVIVTAGDIVHLRAHG